MKGLKCQLHFRQFWVFLLALFLPVFSCIFISKDVSAIEILGTGSTVIQTAAVKGWAGNNQIVETWPMTHMSIGGTGRLFRYYYNGNASMRYNEIQMLINPNYGNDTIMHLSLRISKFSRNTSPMGFEGLRGASGSTVISRNCIEMQSIKKDYTDEGSYYQCDYWLYVDSSTNTLRLKGEIWVDLDNSDFYLDVLENVDVLTLDQGLSSADIDSLGNTITSALEDLEDTVAASGGATPAQIESAVESAIADSGVIAAQQATTRAIESQTQQQHDDYEAEVEREESKEEELNEQKDDLNISAQNPGNPFANLFNVSGCVSLPVFSQWFHQDHVTQVCSPYPEQTRPVIEFVSSVIVIGLLIRIYFKNFKGGYAS